MKIPNRSQVKAHIVYVLKGLLIFVTVLIAITVLTGLLVVIVHAMLVMFNQLFLLLQPITDVLTRLK